MNNEPITPSVKQDWLSRLMHKLEGQAIQQKIQNLSRLLALLGDFAVETFHILGLFVIGGTIVWTAIHTYSADIMHKPYASLDDILLLFIYLELGAMVGIFFRTHRLPVIFLLFISMTALTRYLAIDLKGFDNFKIITIVSAIFILSLAIFILRYSESRIHKAAEEKGLQQRQDISDSDNTHIS